MKWQFVPILTTFLFISLFVTIVTTTIFASPNSCFVDFEHWHTSVAYTHNMANKDFGLNCFNWNASNNQKLLISENKNLIVKLQKGKTGVIDGGVQFNVKFEQALAYVLEYDIFFRDGFEWKNGGFLPGISASTQQNDNNLGFSACPMWQANGNLNISIQSDTTSNLSNQLIPSTYNLVSQKWLHVKEKLYSNLSLSSDGSVDLFVDGQLVVHQNKIQWTKDLKQKADNLLFIVGYSPDQQNNTPSKDVEIYFDNITMNKIK